jgi:NADH-quinone oxidoreductase subunit N
MLLDLFLTKPFKQVTYYLMQLSLLITGVLSFNLIGQPETIIFGHSFVLDDLASVIAPKTKYLSAASIAPALLRAIAMSV